MAGEVFSTYDAVGQAEDVSKVISNIAPTETPFTSMIGKDRVYAKQPEFQEDSLAAAAQGGLIEGADFAISARTPTTGRSNYTQQIGSAFMISDELEAVKKHGRARETAYQTVKLGKELKRNLEVTVVGAAQNATAGNDSTTARLMGNIAGQDPATTAIMTNVNHNSGVPRAWSETILLTALQTAWTNGAPAKYLQINEAQAVTTAEFNIGTNRNRDAGASKTYVNVVEVLMTPYGTTKVMLNRYQPAGTALLFDPEYHKLGYTVNWRREGLAKTGTGEKYAIWGSFTYMHKNYGEGVLIKDIGG